MTRNLAGAYSGWPIPWPAHTLAGAYPGWRIPWPAHTLAGAYPGQRIPWPAHTLSCLVSCLAWFPILLRLVSCLVWFPVLLGFPLLGFLSCLVSCHAWFLSCFQRPFFLTGAYPGAYLADSRGDALCQWAQHFIHFSRNS